MCRRGGIVEMLACHEDADHLREGGDFSILRADDGEQFHEDQQEEGRHREDDQRVVINLQCAGDISEDGGAHRQSKEGEPQHEKDQGVAFFHAIFTESPDGQKEQSRSNRQQDDFQCHVS